MIENEMAAPILTEAANPTGPDDRPNAQENYSTKSARAALDDFLATITDPQKRAQIEAAVNRQVQKMLSDDPRADLATLLPPLKTLQSADILQKEFPPIPWIVPDYLPPGLVMLFGKPKVGKSWLALQLALSVMTGGMMFGKPVPQGRVLYLALEDSERRLKDRMLKQHWPVNQSIQFMLFGEFKESIGALNSGGGKRLLAKIEADKYSLVIVDTFSRSIDGDQLDSREMTEAIGPLQAYAQNSGISLAMIDHMRKNTGEGTDPIQHLYGSVAKAGVADTFWGLYREQGKRGAKLAITGRDVDEFTLKLDFDPQGFYWHCEGNAEDVELTQRRKEILAALEDLGPVTLTLLAQAIGQDTGNTYKRLADMVNAGLVTRDTINGAAVYRLPSKSL